MLLLSTLRENYSTVLAAPEVSKCFKSNLLLVKNRTDVNFLKFGKIIILFNKEITNLTLILEI